MTGMAKSVATVGQTTGSDPVAAGEPDDATIEQVDHQDLVDGEQADDTVTGPVNDASVTAVVQSSASASGSANP